ncbi:AAA family ATPase [Bowmanella yangjiangensis]|uniref:AAA family ATPase n=1 Tax=Bowmanella yangjiangensis TaxID=2811230 RepID=A0ABS3CVT7_9ALTE|nr:AAA family ATPase [Bowmanella yangjiangensis]MBN7819744.1 AAA family ATPase [Bowmanella yangjiangensis]
MQIVRIFISSPSDVAEERERAKEVVRRLQRRYTHKLELVPVMWEDMFLDAEVSFQEGIEQIIDSDCSIDIAVFILWSRLGSPLGSKILRPDGGQYKSGTEREFDLMLQAREKAKERGLGSRPSILAYRREDDKAFNRRLLEQSHNQIEEAIIQNRLAEEFIQEYFYDEVDGSNKRAYTSYDGPSSFAARLRVHLQTKLDELLQNDHLLKEGWDIAEQGSPYRGLESFDVEHEQIFFGREQEIAEVQILFEKQNEAGSAFVLLVGASGSGKSSLAKAGIIPAIRHYDSNIAQCRYMVMTPGEYADDLITGLVKTLASATALPELFDSANNRITQNDLIEALRENPTTAVKLTLLPELRRIAETVGGAVRLVVLIDQLEELLSNPTITEDEINAFAQVISVLASSGSVWVMATLRSDFYGDLQNYAKWMALKGQGSQYDVLPLGAAYMHRVITEPAWLSGLQFEKHPQSDERLDQYLLSDALEEPDALPLLQYTLRELYEKRGDSRVLTFDSYRNIGGVTGALGKRAEAVWESLPTTSRDILVPRLFRSLVTIDHERKLGAKVLTVGVAQDERIHEAFVQARLLVKSRSDNDSGTIIRLAHEAIIRCWPRLQQWLDDSQEFLQARFRMENAYNRWNEERQKEGDKKKADDYLLPEGKPLAEAQDMLVHWRAELQPELQEYITLSDAHHQSRRRKRLRQYQFAIGLLLVLSTLAIFSGGIAFNQSDKASSALDLSLKSVDKLAIEVIDQLKDTWDTPAPEKMALAATIDHRLGTLATDITGSNYLTSSYGRLLTSTSEMALELGLTDKAHAYAKKSTQLYANQPQLDGISSLIESAEAQITMAESARIFFDKPLAMMSIENAQLIISQVNFDRLDDLLQQKTRLLNARIKRVQVDLAADKGNLTQALDLNQSLLNELKTLQNTTNNPETGNKVTQLLVTAYEREKYLRERIGENSSLNPEWKNGIEKVQQYFNEADLGNSPHLANRIKALRAAILQQEDNLGAGITLLDEVIAYYDQLLISDPDNRAWKKSLIDNLANHQLIADQIGLKEVTEIDALTRGALFARLREDGPIDEQTLLEQFAYHWAVTKQKINDAKQKKENEQDQKVTLFKEAQEQLLQQQMLIDLAAALGAESEQLNRLRFLHSNGRIDFYRANQQWKEAEAVLQRASLTLGTPKNDSEKIQNFWLLIDQVSLMSSQSKNVPDALFDNIFGAEKTLQTLGIKNYHASFNYLHRVRANFYHKLEDGNRTFEETLRSLNVIEQASIERPLTCNDVQNTLWSLESAIWFQKKYSGWNNLPIIERAKTIVQKIPDGLPCAKQETLINDWRSMSNILASKSNTCVGASAAKAEQQLCAEYSHLEQALRDGLTRMRNFDTTVSRYTTPNIAPFPQVSEKQARDIRNRIAALKQDGWIGKPLMSGNWQDLHGDALKDAIKYFASLEQFKNTKLEDSIAHIRQTNLTSFPEAKLLEAEYASATGLTPIVAILVTPNKVYELNDHYSSIRAAADELSIRNKDTATDYIRFYFAYIMGRHGRFIIVENEADINWLNTANKSQRDNILKLLRPIEMTHNPAREGYWTGSATMLLNDTLFTVTIDLLPSGSVIMSDQIILAEVIPVAEDYLRYTSAGYVVQQDSHDKLPSFLNSAEPSLTSMTSSVPNMKGAWRTLVGDEYRQALRRFFQAATDGLPPALFVSSEVQIKALNLPFYQDGQLLEATYMDGLGERALVTIVTLPNGVTFLNGTSPPIHHINKEQKLSLNSSEFVDIYIRFFCLYVQGDEGPFRLVESLEELPWAESVKAEDRLQVEGKIRPLTVTPDPKNSGHWLAKATVQYSNTLFEANFSIAPSGMVEMLSDEPLAENLLINPPKMTKRGLVNVKGVKRLQSIILQSNKDIYRETINITLQKPETERPSHWRELMAESLFYEMRNLKADDNAPAVLNKVIDTAINWWQSTTQTADVQAPSNVNNSRTAKLAIGLLTVALEIAKELAPELNEKIETEREKMQKG